MRGRAGRTSSIPTRGSSRQRCGAAHGRRSTTDMVALFDRMLRHSNYHVKWELLQEPPDDDRLIGGMFHVLAERWGWQERTAQEWLAQVGGAPRRTRRSANARARRCWPSTRTSPTSMTKTSTSPRDEDVDDVSLDPDRDYTVELGLDEADDLATLAAKLAASSASPRTACRRSRCASARSTRGAAASASTSSSARGRTAGRSAARRCARSRRAGRDRRRRAGGPVLRLRARARGHASRSSSTAASRCSRGAATSRA